MFEPLRRLRIALPLALACAALAAGCGASDSDQVKSVFRQSTRALAAGDGATFCSTLTPAAQQNYARQISNATNAPDCETGVKDLLMAVKALSVGDWTSYCGAISRKAANSLAAAGPGLNVPASCVAAAAKINSTPAGRAAFASLKAQLSQSLARLESGQLGRIQVTGDRAVAAITGAKPADAPVRFQKLDGHWKIAQE